MTDPRVSRSRLRRAAERFGLLLIASLLGAALVASSALSYRDAKGTMAVVAERQGIGLLHRFDRSFGRGRVQAEQLAAALEANRSLGLSYVAVLDRGQLVAEAGEPLLPEARPAIGAPVFGRERVRMVSAGPGRLGPGPPHARRHGAPDAPPGPFGPPSPPPGPPPPPDRAGPPPEPPHDIVIEFEPIGAAHALRRALAVLILSSGAAGLLTLAALVVWANARRAQAAELRLASQRHLAQIGEMSAVLAHEIRNPLAALKGHAQLLAEGAAGTPFAGRVDRVVAEAVRLEHLTNDLLDFARVGALDVHPSDPAEVLARAIRATAPDRVTASTEDSPARWPFDGPRVEQVLINLLDNALAVTPPDLKVEAVVGCEGDALVFAVRDRGPGVPLEDRARIFEAFETTKLRGTGLGLAVAKRIVELHGGWIDVGDAPGGGARFRVGLPGARAA